MATHTKANNIVTRKCPKTKNRDNITKFACSSRTENTIKKLMHFILVLFKEIFFKTIFFIFFLVLF